MTATTSAELRHSHEITRSSSVDPSNTWVPPLSLPSRPENRTNDASTSALLPADEVPKIRRTRSASRTREKPVRGAAPDTGRPALPTPRLTPRTREVMRETVNHMTTHFNMLRFQDNASHAAAITALQNQHSTVLQNVERNWEQRLKVQLSASTDDDEVFASSSWRLKRRRWLIGCC
jgi:hypothetical protein